MNLIKQMSCFYLSVFIYNYFKNELKLLIYFIFGLSYCFIGFIVNLITKDNNKDNTLIFLCLSGGEIIFLLILIKVLIQKNILVINQSFWNIVIFDFSKYIIIGLLLKLLASILLCLGCPSNTSKNLDEEKSVATYMGPNGEIFDQNGKRIW